MRTRSTTAATTALAAVLLFGASAGCSQQPESTAPVGQGATHAELVSKAKEEGSVTWYTTNHPDRVAEVAEAFEKKYGIQVEPFRGPSGQLLQRYKSERDAKTPTVDVLDTGLYAPIKDNPDDFVSITDAPLDSLDQWPADFISDAGNSVTIGRSPVVIVYNTKKVPESEIPNTWPEFMGNSVRKLAVPDFSGTLTYVAFLNFLRDSYGDAMLRDFANAPKKVFDSTVPAMQAIASGAQPLGVGFPVLLGDLKNQGAPIDWIIPDKTTHSVNVAGVPDNSPHPNAGLLLLDFLMSQEGQSLYGGELVNSPLPSVSGDLSFGSAAVEPNQGKAQAEREELVQLAGLQ